MIAWTQHRTSNGIYYEVQGAGKPIVLLHGFCGSMAYWTPIISELSRDYQVITVDLRGHGQSDVIHDSFQMEDMAADIIQVLDDMKLEQAYVFGHSLGGYITLALAEQHPERLLGFSLVHSTANPDAEAAKENRLKAVETIQHVGIEYFVNELIPKLFAPEHLETMPGCVERAKQIGYATLPAGAIGASLAMRARPDRNHVLASASLPILLIAGAQDQVVPKEKTFTVQADHIQEALIPGAGHMSMMEAPAALIAHIRAFV